MLTDAARPTANLITVTINEDGTASFALPRDGGRPGHHHLDRDAHRRGARPAARQGEVTLAPARPELLFNQLTGGSNTTISTYTPIRVAAAVARVALLDAAAIVLGDTVAGLVAKGGVITAPDGASVTYGELAAQGRQLRRPRGRGRSSRTRTTSPWSARPTNRVDALAAVTGAKDFTTDLDVAGRPADDGLPGAHAQRHARVRSATRPRSRRCPASPTSRRSAPASPSAPRPSASASTPSARSTSTGRTGPVAGESDATILRKLRAAQLPMPALPDTPLAPRRSSGDFTFYFRSNSAMDTNCRHRRRARRRRRPSGPGSSRRSSRSSRSPEARHGARPGEGQRRHRGRLLRPPAVLRRRPRGGRDLAGDGPAGQADVAPRRRRPGRRGAPDGHLPGAGDGPRQEVLAFNQSLTCVETDFRHGLGEIITAAAADLPGGLGNLGFAADDLRADPGGALRLRRRHADARRDRRPVQHRLDAQHLLTRRTRRRRARRRPARREDEAWTPTSSAGSSSATSGSSRSSTRSRRPASGASAMPAGTAQGIAIHKEYKGVSACLVEIDCPTRDHRPRRSATPSPGRASPGSTFAIDVGLVVNPRGSRRRCRAASTTASRWR